jgi:site-specific DNA recombinase
MKPSPSWSANRSTHSNARSAWPPSRRQRSRSAVQWTYSASRIREGGEHQGDHEAIVGADLFETVQAVIRQHLGGCVRERRHHHYLRGKLFCQTCDSRWTDMQVKRRRYRYFFCLGRHLRRSECDEPYMPAEELERLVEAQYFRVFIPDERKEQIRRFVAEEVKRRYAGLSTSKDAARRRIEQLENERQRLLRLYLAGGLEMESFQREQDRIATETQALQARAEPEAGSRSSTTSRPLTSGPTNGSAGCGTRQSSPGSG